MRKRERRDAKLDFLRVEETSGSREDTQPQVSGDLQN